VYFTTIVGISGVFIDLSLTLCTGYFCALT
jgi:hypothetical protein